MGRGTDRTLPTQSHNQNLALQEAWQRIRKVDNPHQCLGTPPPRTHILPFASLMAASLNPAAGSEAPALTSGPSSYRSSPWRLTRREAMPASCRARAKYSGRWPETWLSSPQDALTCGFTITQKSQYTSSGWLLGLPLTLSEVQELKKARVQVPCEEVLK